MLTCLRTGTGKRTWASVGVGARACKNIKPTYPDLPRPTLAYLDMPTYLPRTYLVAYLGRYEQGHPMGRLDVRISVCVVP